MNPDHKRETVRSADGTAVGFAKVGSGPAVVFVHGALTTGQQWLPVAQALGADCESFVMDRRGRGHSGDSAEYSVDRETEDIQAVLAAAGPGAHLLGHSSGAIYALEAARRGSVAGLILYEPPLHYETFREAGFLDRMRRDVAEGRLEDAVVLFVKEELRMTDESLSAFRAAPQWDEMVALAPTFVREWDAIFDLSPDIDRYRDIAAQTLLLYGTQTAAHPTFATRALEAALANVRKAALEGQGHAAHLGTPALVAEQIRRFVLRAS